METLTQFLRKTYLGNTFQEWLIAIVLSITMMIAIYLIRKLLVRKFTVLAERTETQIDDFLVDLLRRTRYLLIPSSSIFFGSQFLELKPNIVRYIDGAIILVLVLQGAFWANASIAYIIEHTMKKRKISGEIGRASCRERV